MLLRSSINEKRLQFLANLSNNGKYIETNTHTRNFEYKKTVNTLNDKQNNDERA